MDRRQDRESLRRLRHVAAGLTPQAVEPLLQPFVEQWSRSARPDLKDVRVPMDPDLRFSAPTLADLAARIRVIGMNLNKSGLKGVEYHNALQRQLAALAGTFDCQGWTETPALFDEPETADRVLVKEGDPVKQGDPVFEIDSTVKARSFQKLKGAAAAHKVWVYFGKDVWGFRTFLQREDAGKEILPVIVPRTFVPSFEDQG